MAAGPASAKGWLTATLVSIATIIVAPLFGAFGVFLSTFASFGQGNGETAHIAEIMQQGTAVIFYGLVVSVLMVPVFIFCLIMVLWARRQARQKL